MMHQVGRYAEHIAREDIISLVDADKILPLIIEVLGSTHTNLLIDEKRLMTTALVEAGRSLEIVRFTVVSAISLVLYEYAIKFDDEIHYLWHRNLSFVSVLLFSCRYLPLVTIIQGLHTYVATSDFGLSHCLTGLIINSCLIYLEFSLSVLVLFTGAYAVWGRSRPMLVVLSVIYSCAIVMTAYMLDKHISGFSAVGFHIGNGCVFIIGNNTIWITLVIQVSCDTLATSLLVVKSVQHARILRIAKNTGGGEKLDLLRIMARDGIGYFILNLAVTVANIIVLMRVGSGLRDFMLTMHGGLQNVLCARLLFHIYSVNDRRSNENSAETDWTTSQIGMTRNSGGSTYYDRGCRKDLHTYLSSVVSFAS